MPTASYNGRNFDQELSLAASPSSCQLPNWGKNFLPIHIRTTAYHQIRREQCFATSNGRTKPPNLTTVRYMVLKHINTPIWRSEMTLYSGFPSSCNILRKMDVKYWPISYWVFSRLALSPTTNYRSGSWLAIASFPLFWTLLQELGKPTYHLPIYFQ